MTTMALPPARMSREHRFFLVTAIAMALLIVAAFSLAAPFALAALAALPVLWWLLRVTPPRPKRIAFPPLRIAADLLPERQSPARTPPWLLILRLLAAAALILAATPLAAEELIMSSWLPPKHPEPAPRSSGPWNAETMRPLAACTPSG